MISNLLAQAFAAYRNFKITRMIIINTEELKHMQIDFVKHSITGLLTFDMSFAEQREATEIIEAYNTELLVVIAMIVELF